jgi:hypothetical protein
MKLKPIAEELALPELLQAIERFERILLNDSIRHQLQGGIPLLLDSPYGAKLRTQPTKPLPNDPMAYFDTVAHDDQLTAIFFCQSRNLLTPIRTPTGRILAVSDILNNSLMTYCGGRELEWTLISYCGYLQSLTFRNSVGSTIDVVGLISDLLRQESGKGACLGTHRLKALAICRQRLEFELLQGKHSPDVISQMQDLVHEIDAFFSDITLRLELTQTNDGSWDESWFAPSFAAKSARAIAPDFHSLSRRGMVTSHLLEWIALTPPNLRPSSRCTTRAANYLTTVVIDDGDYYADQHLLLSCHTLLSLYELVDFSNQIPTQESAR